jgi:hypothetical protein
MTYPTSIAMQIEEYDRKHRQFIEAIRPLIEMKAKIVDVQPSPIYVLNYDGTSIVRVETRWSPESQQSFALIDKQINAIGKTIFGELWDHEPR